MGINIYETCTKHTVLKWKFVYTLLNLYTVFILIYLEKDNIFKETDIQFIWWTAN